jgi:citrate lyase beta subunit
MQGTNMNILIWKSHGDIRVYDVSTPDKLKAQIEDTLSCIQDWGMDKTIGLVQKHIEKHPDDIKELTRAFNIIKDAVDPGSHEMFEDFYITVLE